MTGDDPHAPDPDKRRDDQEEEHDFWDDDSPEVRAAEEAEPFDETPRDPHEYEGEGEDESKGGAEAEDTDTNASAAPPPPPPRGGGPAAAQSAPDPDGGGRRPADQSASSQSRERVDYSRPMPGSEEEEEGFEEKPFLEHLEDLRWTLIKSMIALAVGMLACFIFTPLLLDLLNRPLVVIGTDPKDFLENLGVVDPFSVHIQIGMFGGFILSLPAILFFLGEFLLPALTRREKRLVLPVFAGGAVLFISGVVFCYFVILPFALQFFIDYSTYMGWVPKWTPPNYISFVLIMLVAFGISFELPLVLLLLNWFGIVSASMLSEYRRHAIVGIVIFSACITPTGDAFTLMLMSGPMYILYEACVWITHARERIGAG